MATTTKTVAKKTALSDSAKEAGVGQNLIDMNDPGLTMEEAVAENLKLGGSGAVAGEPVEEKA